METDQANKPGEGRLVKALRDVAAERDPIFALASSAIRFYQGDTVMGNALADLAVTGRAAYGNFARKPPKESDLGNALAPAAVWPGKRPPSDLPKVKESIRTALRRAYLVAWAIRDTANTDEFGSTTLGAKARNEIRNSQWHWIAVSGEDDSPHRPVNVPSAPYPQYDIDVTSHGQTFQIRYMIANPP